MKKNALLALLILLLPVPVYGTGISHTINVQIGVFDAAKAEMTYDINPKNYFFSSMVETAGVFGGFYPFRAEYSTSGKIAKNQRLITKDYHYKSQSKSHTRTKQLVFNKHGVLDYRLSSKDNEHKRVEIELPDYSFQASDLQTIFAALTLQLKQNKFCDMEKTVFDGKKSYKITVRDEGKTLLQDNEVPFSGPAWKCSMYISRLDTDDGDMLWDTASERPIKFWIMENEKNSMPFLAKIEIDSTPLGRLKAYTTQIQSND